MTHRLKTWIITLGVAVILFMSLFPPWMYYVEDLTISLRDDAGRHFLFAPPESLVMPTGDLPMPIEARVDMTQLLIEWATVAGLTVICLLIINPRTSMNR